MKHTFAIAVSFACTLGLVTSCKLKRPERPLFGPSLSHNGEENLETSDNLPEEEIPTEEVVLEEENGGSSEGDPSQGEGGSGNGSGSGSENGGESGKGTKDNPSNETKPTEPKPETKPSEPKPADPKPTEPTPKEPTMKELITEAQFNEILKDRIPFYTYKGFIEAAESTPKFAKVGSVEMRKTEIAAILSNGMHESDHFKAVREYNTAVWGHYCDPKQVPCMPGQTYQGRGPIQLSWNYNYKDAGTDLGIDLLNNPDLVATDPKIAFQTMFWFWTKRGAVTCHDAIVNGKGGFSQTIKTINGGLECNPNRTAVQKEQALMRGTYFKKVMKIMGLPEPTGNLDCL